MSTKEKKLPTIGFQLIEHEMFGLIRFVMINWEPWFVAVDVCKVLGYKNSRDALAKHVPDKYKNTVAIRDGIPGNPNMTVISEPGLYRLIMRSNMPAAEKFMDCVCENVLPSIRKYGYYVAPNQRIITIETYERFRAFCERFPEGAVELKDNYIDFYENEYGELKPFNVYKVVLHLPE